MFKKKKDLPYNFDIDEEYKQYKNIGNHDSKIKTYIEWEHYIRNKFIPFTEIVRLNFIHFIKREKRREERSLATLDAIWMPLNIFVLTVFMTFMFACAEVIKNYNADLSNVVNNYFITMIIPYDSYHESQITIPTIRGNRTSNTLFSSTCKVADAQ